MLPDKIFFFFPSLGKRDAEDELEKQVSAKKQKINEVTETKKKQKIDAVPEKKPAKVQKKKKESSSDDSSSSDSEEDKVSAVITSVFEYYYSSSFKSSTCLTQHFVNFVLYFIASCLMFYVSFWVYKPAAKVTLPSKPKVASAAKNGTVAAKKKVESSDSSDSDSSSDEETVNLIT